MPSVRLLVLSPRSQSSQEGGRPLFPPLGAQSHVVLLRAAFSWTSSGPSFSGGGDGSQGLSLAGHASALPQAASLHVTLLFIFDPLSVLFCHISYFPCASPNPVNLVWAPIPQTWVVLCLSISPHCLPCLGVQPSKGVPICHSLNGGFGGIC